MKSRLLDLRDWLWSQVAYAYFITPLPIPMPKHLRPAIKIAKDWFYSARTEVFHYEQPRPYVLHYFASQKPNRQKILLAHGWMSCSVYMTKLIYDLTLAGFDVYALDFPAHGESKGLQITWDDAVSVLADVNQRHGRFNAALGHSFGGIMLLNLVNLADMLPEFDKEFLPEKIIMLAAPTRMRMPMFQAARRLRLSRGAFHNLLQMLHSKAKIDLIHHGLKHFIKQKLDIPFLCIHGYEDGTIPASESEIFCENYPQATLHLLPHLDHINIVLDPKVTEIVLDYLDQ